MKHRFLTILSFIVGFAVISNVMADNMFTPYYYVGGSAGFADTKWSYAGFSSTGFAFGAYGGYQFNRYFAVEGQFTHFPKASKDGNSVKTNAVAAFLKGSIGLGQTRFKLFSKVGVGNVFNSGFSSKNHFGFAFAYGVDFPLSQNLTAEAAYTHYIGKYSSPDISSSVPNVDYYSVGLAYTFPKNLFG